MLMNIKVFQNMNYALYYSGFQLTFRQVLEFMSIVTEYTFTVYK